MPYTKEDYKWDLQIVALGSSGPEKWEAETRIRLYEAGRHDQLNALLYSQNKAEIDFNRLMDEMQRIDDDVFRSHLLWLNTPSSQTALWNEREKEYERKKKEGELKKAQLQAEYDRKHQSQSTGSNKGKLIGALMFVGGLALLVSSCARLGFVFSTGGWWGLIIAFVGFFVFMLSFG